MQNSDVLHAFVAMDRTGGTENTISHAEKFRVRVILHEEEQKEFQSLSITKVEDSLKGGSIPHTSVWQYRGRIFATIPKNFYKHVEDGFFVSKSLGDWLIIASKWIDWKAEYKQILAGNLDKEEKEEIRDRQKLQYKSLLHASFGEDASNGEYYAELDDLKVQEIEDDLDSSRFGLGVEEGYAGHLYKEDRNLERAQKLEHQIDKERTVRW